MPPEIFTKKGENLLRLDKTTQGIAELQRAIEMKSDYWPPRALSDDLARIRPCLVPCDLVLARP